jgi:hypothetical protein
MAKYNKNYQVEDDVVGWQCRANVEKRNTYRFLVARLEEERILGEPRHRWIENIKRTF